MNKANVKTEMLKHSQAKVELYRRYLALYLNILGNVSSVGKILLFDLFCGEGVYQDNSPGSPIAALEAIKEYYFSHNRTCPNIEIWLNDKGLSEIEAGIAKISRVERYCAAIFKPSNVSTQFFQEDFDDIYPQALDKVHQEQGAKSLFFIDPYGYKAVKPSQVRDLISCGDTEVILFLPATYMYRFAERAVRMPFAGSDPLAQFIYELYGNQSIRFSSVYDFIEQTKQQFKRYLGATNYFVDTFTLERDKQNIYCLFFFTGHVRGFEKMLETKWQLDTEQGRGFRHEQTTPLFGAMEISGYPRRLLDFIGSALQRTNTEIYRFSLENGFLSKHTNEVLRGLCEYAIEIYSLDGKPIRKNSTYINYDTDRRVAFRLRE